MGQLHDRVQLLILGGKSQLLTTAACHARGHICTVPLERGHAACVALVRVFQLQPYAIVSHIYFHSTLREIRYR